MNPLKRFVEFISKPGHSRTITALVILIIAAAVPLTVLVAQQQHNTKQKAAVASLISCKTTTYNGYCSATSCAGSGTSINTTCMTYSAGTQNYCCPIATATPATSPVPTPSATCQPVPCCYFTVPGCLLPMVMDKYCPITNIPPSYCTGGTPTPIPTTTPRPTATPTPTGCYYDPCPPVSCPVGMYCPQVCTPKLVCPSIVPSATPNPSCIPLVSSSPPLCASNNTCILKQIGSAWYYCPNPTTTPTPTGTPVVNLPDCNSGINNCSACTSSTPNTCSNNGTKTCTYSTSTTGGLCNPKNVVQTCSVNNCTSGYTCNSSGTCISQVSVSPTASTKPSQTPTPAPNPCSDGILSWQVQNLCGDGSTWTKGVYQCSDGLSGQITSSTCASSTTLYEQAKLKCANSPKTCPSPTSSPNPLETPTPTPTPIPGNTYIALVVGMDGVGKAGTHQNPIPAGTQNPAHPQRNVTVRILDSNNNVVVNDKIGTINYNATNGLFAGNFDLGTTFTTGNYIVRVKSDGHLRKTVNGIQIITAGIVNPALPRTDLTAGDINGDNLIDIKDYNILISCMADINNPDGGKLCNTNTAFKTISNLDDNGTVDQFDYNLFLGEYSVQNGD